MTRHDTSLFTAGALNAPIEIREAVPADAEPAGRITYEAFRIFHESRGFAPDFPSIEAAVGLTTALIADPDVFGVVATRDGVVVGSNFLSEGDPIRGIGPITVDPAAQDAGIGRRLMGAVIDRGRKAAGMRLVQDAFNIKTMALYTLLGFDPIEPLAVLTGSPKGALPRELRVRSMTEADVPEAAELSVRVHGFARTRDVRAALAEGTPLVLERGGRIAAYMTRPRFWILNHAVAETDADLKALVRGAANASGDAPLGFLMPIRRAELFRWCLDQGMRVVKPMTLMSRGQYAEPEGAYLPSVMY